MNNYLTKVQFYTLQSSIEGLLKLVGGIDNKVEIFFKVKTRGRASRGVIGSKLLAAMVQSSFEVWLSAGRIKALFEKKCINSLRLSL